MSYIIKRDGTKVPFDENKIRIAIEKANSEMTDVRDTATYAAISSIITKIRLNISLKSKTDEYLHVEEIQDIVEEGLMHQGYYTLARTYIRYRHNRELVRKANTTDESILSLIRLDNVEVMEENSNKAAQIASTQRDLIAGEVSKDLTWRMLLPKDIVDAHSEGILHFHEK